MKVAAGADAEMSLSATVRESAIGVRVRVDCGDTS